MSVSETAATIERTKLVAIIRLQSEQRSAAAIEALVGAGVEVIEFSLATEAALPALRAAIERFGADATIGAGTVLTPEQAVRAHEAGARFLVAPNLDRAVVEQAASLGILHIPGAMTPTEVAAASAMGASLIKLFPGSALGPKYVRELLAPMPNLRLVPTGGLDESNVRSFLDAGAVAVGMAGALIGGAADAGALTARARRFRELIEADAGAAR